MIFSVGHRLARCLLGCVMVSARRQVSKDAGLAAGILHARLQIIDRAGRNPHAEQVAQVMQAVRDFPTA